MKQHCKTVAFFVQRSTALVISWGVFWFFVCLYFWLLPNHDLLYFIKVNLLIIGHFQKTVEVLTWTMISQSVIVSKGHLLLREMLPCKWGYIPSHLQLVAEVLGYFFTFRHPKLNFHLQSIMLEQNCANPIHLLGPEIGRKILQSHF